VKNPTPGTGRAVATGAFVVLAFAMLWQMPAPAAASVPRPGEPAPAFTAQNIAGQTVRLADFAGRTIVLEWMNNGCPFVAKHYNSGNMQALQRRHIESGGIWLVVVSSAPGTQGYVTPEEARADLARWGSAPSDFLLDPDGVVGRLYDARVTPQMIVIDGNGRLAYTGAIDDRPSTNPKDVASAKNYVTAALDELAEGRPVSIAATRAYGCTIKYKGG
jgi:hypothetical protein